MSVVKQHEWATSLDSVLFSYLTNYNVITIGNYTNGFYSVDNERELSTIGINRDLSVNDTLHVYFHKFGKPLQKMIYSEGTAGNHFAYLEPLKHPSICIRENSICQNNFESHENEVI